LERWRNVALLFVCLAGLAWIVPATKHAEILAEDGWPTPWIGWAFMASPFLGLVALAPLYALSRLVPRTATVLLVLSLVTAATLVWVETSLNFIGYE